MDSSATAQVLRVFGSKPLPAYALTLELPVYTVGVTDPHTASLATPVFGTDAELLGALTISAPLSRLTPERVEGMKGPLNTAAGELTRALGGFFPDLERAGSRAGRGHGLIDLTRGSAPYHTSPQPTGSVAGGNRATRRAQAVAALSSKFYIATPFHFGY